MHKVLNGGHAGLFNRLPACAGVAAVAALLAPVGAVRAEIPIATFEYSIGASAPTTALPLVGTVTQTGAVSFTKTIVEGPYKIIVNYVADLDPVGNAVINGSTTFENATGDLVTVAMAFDAPICPTVASSKIGGIASVKLICNEGGGQLVCGGDPSYLVCATSDGQVAMPIYWCPFNMFKTGAGTATLNFNFGLPIPSMPGPAYVGSLGHRSNFTVTGGEKVVLSLLYAVNGTINTIAEDPCPGDANGDGVVDKDDLIAVLVAYGATVGCGFAADLNGDGSVDSADIGLILGAWGACPG